METVIKLISLIRENVHVLAEKKTGSHYRHNTILYNPVCIQQKTTADICEVILIQIVLFVFLGMLQDTTLRLTGDVTKTGNGERGTGNGERKSGNELSAETSTKIQNGGPKNEREKEDDKERNSCLG